MQSDCCETLSTGEIQHLIILQPSVENVYLFVNLYKYSIISAASPLQVSYLHSHCSKFQSICGLQRRFLPLFLSLVIITRLSLKLIFFNFTFCLKLPKIQRSVLVACISLNPSPVIGSSLSEQAGTGKEAGIGDVLGRSESHTHQLLFRRHTRNQQLQEHRGDSFTVSGVPTFCTTSSLDLHLLKNCKYGL